MGWTEAELTRIVQQPGYHVIGEPRPPVSLPEDTPEGAFAAKIRAVAQDYGWFFYHTYDARRSDPGMLDFFLTNGRDILIYEGKTNTGKLTKDQALLLSLLTHTEKVECGIWRPHMWGEIVERLTRRRSH